MKQLNAPTLLESLLGKIPFVHRYQVAKREETAKWIKDHPDEPCVIGGEYFPTGTREYRGDELPAHLLREKNEEHIGG